jgi:hypothetical protein
MRHTKSQVLTLRNHLVTASQSQAELKADQPCTAVCIQWQISLRGDVPSVSWNRWPQLRGGADTGFSSC